MEWVTVALLRWASGLGDPRPDLREAIFDCEQILSIAGDEARKYDLWRYTNAAIGSFCQLLIYPTNHPELLDAARPPEEFLLEQVWYLYEPRMDYLLLEALRTGRFFDEWDALIDMGESFRKLSGPVESYINYWNLIEAWKAGDAAQVVEIVGDCEKHFAARPQMPYYMEQGEGLNGGWEHPPTVDYRLAAIVKVLEGFGGDGAPQIQTRHRWRWHDEA